MTSGPIGLDLAEVAKSNAPQLLDVPAAPGIITEKNEKTLTIADEEPAYTSDGSLRGPDGEEYPTAEEVEKLRRVCGPVPWSAYTIAFVELCERFSYYGTTVVCKCHTRHDGDVGVETKSSMMQSSISSKILCRMDRRPALLAPTGSRVLWAWVSALRPA